MIILALQMRDCCNNSLFLVKAILPRDEKQWIFFNLVILGLAQRSIFTLNFRLNIIK